MFIKLNNEFNLVQANPKDFAVHYNTYRENIFFRQSWERRMSIFGDDIPAFWILLKEKRIGGVCLKPNMLWSFFLEPPFTDIHSVLRRLKKYMIEISDITKPIKVIGILPYETEHFLRLGFQPIETRRIMIRPTEKFEKIDWGNDFSIKTPTVEYFEEIVQLSYKSYFGGIDNTTIEQERLDLEYFFKNCNEELLLRSSNLVFDKENNKLVGACFVSMWEDLPNIYSIVVDPRYQGKGIATNLLRKSLTVLKEKHEIIRLFVTVGNPAESLYYNLGFLPGVEQVTFNLPCKE